MPKEVKEVVSLWPQVTGQRTVFGVCTIFHPSVTLLSVTDVSSKERVFCVARVLKLKLTWMNLHHMPSLAHPRCSPEMQGAGHQLPTQNSRSQKKTGLRRLALEPIWILWCLRDILRMSLMFESTCGKGVVIFANHKQDYSNYCFSSINFIYISQKMC